MHGEQLYDLDADPAQTTDVSNKYPDVAARMRSHLDRWWQQLGPDFAGYERVAIGSAQDNPTTLTACEWLDVFVDQQNQVRQGVLRNGTWHLEADHAGRYEFHLRRWPAESGLALDQGIPPTEVVDGEYGAGKALPIHGARLHIGEQEYKKSAEAGDESISFKVVLAAGPFEMQATFLDDEGNELCGAYYVEAQALPNSPRSVP